MRPASSSSNRMVATAAADNWHCRTSSSTATGVGPRHSTTASVSPSPPPGAGCGGGGAGCAAGRHRRRGRPLAQGGAELVEDVGGGLGEDGAVAEQVVGAAAARIERRARHGEHVAPLFEGEAGGDQRA